MRRSGCLRGVRRGRSGGYTIGTVEPVDYVQVSALATDAAALQNDVVGIDGNLSLATSVTVVVSTLTTAIDKLGGLGS